MKNKLKDILKSLEINLENRILNYLTNSEQCKEVLTEVLKFRSVNYFSKLKSKNSFYFTEEPLNEQPVFSVGIARLKCNETVYDIYVYVEKWEIYTNKKVPFVLEIFNKTEKKEKNSELDKPDKGIKEKNSGFFKNLFNKKNKVKNIKPIPEPVVNDDKPFLFTVRPDHGNIHTLLYEFIFKTMKLTEDGHKEKIEI